MHASPDRGVSIGRLRFAALDEPGVIAHVIAQTQVGRGGWLVNPNVDVLRQVAKSEEVAALASSADLVVADGVPVLWAARLLGTPLPGLVAGSDLIWSLSAAADQAGLRVFLLGGAPGVAERASAEMVKRLGIAPPGYYCPPFGFEREPSEQQRIVDVLREAAPAIVFCGLGFPKQERLMKTLTGQFPSTWFVGTGASIAFVAGEVPRAPDLLRGSGLEWAFRLATEPRRLFKRYIILDGPFALRLLSAAALTGLRRKVRQRAGWGARARAR